MKTRDELKAELTESFKDVPEQPGLPKELFINAALDLIEQGRATWDGTHLRLIEGNA